MPGLEPIVHEIKVSHADLLGDLKKPNKRAAYLGLGGECWYVLGQTAKGKPIVQPDEIPPECGVLGPVTRLNLMLQCAKFSLGVWFWGGAVNHAMVPAQARGQWVTGSMGSISMTLPFSRLRSLSVLGKLALGNVIL